MTNGGRGEGGTNGAAVVSSMKASESGTSSPSSSQQAPRRGSGDAIAAAAARMASMFNGGGFVDPASKVAVDYDGPAHGRGGDSATGTKSTKNTGLLSRASWFFRGGRDNNDDEDSRAPSLGASSRQSSVGRMIRNSFMAGMGRKNPEPLLQQLGSRKGVTVLREAELAVLKIFRSPIALGYLMHYCEMEHNEEYLLFFLAVEEYRAEADAATGVASGVGTPPAPASASASASVSGSGHHVAAPSRPTSALRTRARSARRNSNSGGRRGSHGTGVAEQAEEVPLRWVATDDRLFHAVSDDLMNRDMLVSLWQDLAGGDPPPHTHSAPQGKDAITGLPWASPAGPGTRPTYRVIADTFLDDSDAQYRAPLPTPINQHLIQISPQAGAARNAGTARRSIADSAIAMITGRRSILAAGDDAAGVGGAGGDDGDGHGGHGGGLVRRSIGGGSWNDLTKAASHHGSIETGRKSSNSLAEMLGGAGADVHRAAADAARAAATAAFLATAARDDDDADALEALDEEDDDVDGSRGRGYGHGHGHGGEGPSGRQPHTARQPKATRRSIVGLPLTGRRATLTSIDSWADADNITPITLSQRVLLNTRCRLAHAEAYGAEVFGEAALEVLRYVAREIYPRFLRSPMHDRMAKRGKAVFDFTGKNVLPRGTALRVKAPDSPIIAEMEARRNNKQGKRPFSINDAIITALGGEDDEDQDDIAHRGPHLYTVDEIINDSILYNEFAYRLRMTSQADLAVLFCVRCIRHFKHLLASQKEQQERPEKEKKDLTARANPTHTSLRQSLDNVYLSLRNPPTTARRDERRWAPKSGVRPPEPLCSPEAEDEAWRLYLFFVASGAVYEIPGLPAEKKKEVQQALARPHVFMFADLEQIVNARLHRIFDDYKKNHEKAYQEWEYRAKTVAKNTIKVESRGGKWMRWIKQNGLRNFISVREY